MSICRQQGRAIPGIAALIAAVLVFFAIATSAQAQDNPGHAGLVIVHGDGKVTTQCVAFPEASISGYELLKRAGLVLNVEAAAVGTTICSIDSEGCSYPKESCFCRCQGSPCVYWSYWRRDATGWQYQNLGAAYTKVSNGDVEGWHWAAGTVTDSKAPPDLDFASICEGGATSQAVDATSALTATPAVTSTPAEIAMSVTDTATAGTASVAAAATVAAAAQPVDVQPALGLLWGVLIALVVMPLAAFAVLKLIQRQQGK